jgi:G3E family GTPase
MNIKTEIEIVTGFLSSGKTTFINALLKNTLLSKEIVIVIQCEAGSTHIKNIEKQKSKIIVKQIGLYKVLSASYITQIIEFYKPHRIIIEHNGTRLLQDILNIFNDKTIELSCREPIIYHVTDAALFKIFYQNMKELIEPYVINSHLIVINNCANISKQEKKVIVKTIEVLNPTAVILTNENLIEVEDILKKAEVLDNGITKRVLIRMKNRQAKKAVRSR